MPVTHPVALRDGRSHPSGYTYGTVTHTIDSDGEIDCPADLEDEIAQALADHYDADAEQLLDSGGDDAEAETTDDADTCDTVKSDGEVCGRELPCQYHSED